MVILVESKFFRGGVIGKEKLDDRNKNSKANKVVKKVEEIKENAIEGTVE